MLLDPRAHVYPGDDSCRPNLIETDIQTNLSLFLSFHEKHNCSEDWKTCLAHFHSKETFTWEAKLGRISNEYGINPH